MQKNLQKNNKFKIGNFSFKNKNTFIVAEISSNHNGSLSRAINLIRKAKQVGADAVKLQTFTAETITINSDKKDFRLNHLKNSQWKKYKNFYSLYKNAETPSEWHHKLFKFANKIGIEFFQVLFSEEAVDLLENFLCCL